jgi:outer membrane PBP1 activator LpoA protein
LITPQLRYNFAGDIPTYATSPVFDTAGTGRDNDLNGVIFADAPSALGADRDARALREDMLAYWPQRAAQVRLYGMGFDAYRLVGALFDGNSSAWPVQGMSGELSVDAAGRIERALPLAQFRNGRPVALEASGRSEELVGFR